MSRPLEPVVPPALMEKIGRPLDPDDGFTILVLCTSDGWPHQAMISAGEIAARDERTLALALWPGSSATRAIEAEGRATLSAVLDGTSYLVRVIATRAGDVETPLAGRLARFDAHVQSATADEAPYAVLESGVRFRLKDPQETLARWREVREALQG